MVAGYQDQYVGGKAQHVITCPGYNDTGGPSRFFKVINRFCYCGKASRRERNAGLEGMETKAAPKTNDGLGRATSLEKRLDKYGDAQPRMQNFHPCVKPVALMEYLCTLTKTPTGGVVLDPFAGTFTTAVACVKTGRDFIGMDTELIYVDIGKARVAHVQLQPRLGI
jgi:hypothetical protein